MVTLFAETTVILFQSTHPSGVRRQSRMPIVYPSIFQSTHPSGVRRPCRGAIRVCRYFNPRTPVGCDALMIGPICSRKISIHAPQWGATRRSTLLLTSRHISIHAPQWGATGRSQSAMSLIQISIHAPQWGATGQVKSVAYPKVHFNPRTPVGCDAADMIDVSSWQFQSTHPSGVRPSVERTAIRCPYFNPRTPVGCDHSQRAAIVDNTISIHAPQWGATSIAHQTQ